MNKQHMATYINALENRIKELETDRPRGEWIGNNLVYCRECRRNADNGGLYDDGRTKCPIQEHYALPQDGFCHLGERNR